MSIASELEKIGLSGKESQVYLAALELAQETAPAIARRAGINRTTAYVVLESLIGKGLASSFSQGGKTYYVAEAPEMLLGLFYLKKKKVEERQEAYEKAAPELRDIYGQAKAAPVVRFFEGKKGLAEMYDDYVASGTESTYIIFSLDDAERVFSFEERKNMAQRRIGKDIKARILYTYEAAKGDPKFTTKAHGSRLRISEKEYPIHCDIALYGSKVRIASMGEKLSGVIIEDREICKTFSTILQLAWEGANQEANGS